MGSCKRAIPLRPSRERELADQRRHDDRGFDPTSAPGPQHPGPGPVQTTSGKEQTGLGMEQTEPGSEQTTSGMEQTRPGSEQTELGLEQTKRGSEQTELGMEQTELGLEQTERGMEQTELGLEQTEPGMEQTGRGIRFPEGGELGWEGVRGVLDIRTAGEGRRSEQNAKKNEKEAKTGLAHGHVSVMLFPDQVRLAPRGASQAR